VHNPVADPPSWLNGRVAVITGAGKGIGRATAEAIAQAGAHVVVAARTAAQVEAVAASIRKAGGAATAVPADVGRPADVDRLFEVAAGIGSPTALVCAAAVLHKAAFDETTLDRWEETIRINLTGAFLCCQKAFPLMRDAGGGRIVNLGSLSGIYATEKFPGLAAYNVSKYGVIGLTEALAVEGRPHGISAICISPGAVETEMLRRANPELRASLTPQQVGALIVSLLEGPVVPASGANIPLFSNA
jgi:NAD(P)-dependent dehydrogenase (short-subunit alcohol dehydrogenase family)